MRAEQYDEVAVAGHVCREGTVANFTDEGDPAQSAHVEAFACYSV